jgi:hypothetical protein
MAHISRHDRSQTLLLPEAVDDYVGADNPVRFIDAFVDKLNLATAGFVGVEAKAALVQFAGPFILRASGGPKVRRWLGSQVWMSCLRAATSTRKSSYCV